MQPDRPYPRPVRITYRVMSYLVILSVPASGGIWLDSLADFPALLAVLAGMVWGTVAITPACAMEVPVLDWAMRGAHRLSGQEPPRPYRCGAPDEPCRCGVSY